MKVLPLSSLRIIFEKVRSMISSSIGTAAQTAAAEASAGWKDFVSDGRPIHNIVNPLVDYYFKLLPALGYKFPDVSRTWYFTGYVSGSGEKNRADRSNPYLVFCKGDYLLLECEGEPSQTIQQDYNYFACYNLLPGKVYRWSVFKDGEVIKDGEFKTIGFARLINIRTWPNVRDIAYYPIMKMNRVLSGANPDNVEVGSDDYNFIKSLGIDFQLNLRTPKSGSSQDKAWRPDLFERGTNINIPAYSASLTSGQANFKKVITTLISELKAGHRVAFNCWAGADRTGTLRYYLQGICGVPKRIAQGYYELTSFMFWENFKRWDDKDGEDDFRYLDKDLEARFGPDFYTQCYLFFTEIVGVTDAQIKDLQKELMVDPSSAPEPKLDSVP